MFGAVFKVYISIHRLQPKLKQNSRICIWYHLLDVVVVLILFILQQSEVWFGYCCEVDVFCIFYEICLFS